MVLKFSLNTGGAPKPVEVRGPTVVDNTSLPGNPLGPTGHMGPGAHPFLEVQFFLIGLYGFGVLYGHLQYPLPLKGHLDPLPGLQHFSYKSPYLYPISAVSFCQRKPGC